MKSLSIIALGSSRNAYFSDFRACRFTRPTNLVWTINHGGWMFNDIDMIVAMDDMRWKAEEYGGYIPAIAARGLPILTFRAYPEYPTAIEFPMEKVLRRLGLYDAFWFKNSINYALAYALYLHLTGEQRLNEVRLYGADFCQRGHLGASKDPKRDPWWRVYHVAWNCPKHEELGSDESAFLLGMMHANAIRWWIPGNSTLLNADLPHYHYGEDLGLRPEYDDDE